ncbi:MAG: DarT ssDNA thymidine ADP-ribosyltransferase family protein [Candidatus Thiodiazotropha endolucinida]
MIKYVYHFTRLQNLDSILLEGLMSRQDLDSCEWDTPPAINDPYRFDNCLDAICCSIGHPNYKMFYRLRQQYKGEEWVVLGLKARILWEKDCAFCVENAASNNVTSIPIEERRSLDAFNQLFEEYDGKPSREDLGIPNKCPTHPQAEILVFENIEPEYIIGAVFESRQRVDEYRTQYDDFQFMYHKAPFKPRGDYEHWR